jgi:hypothetical protein
VRVPGGYGITKPVSVRQVFWLSPSSLAFPAFFSASDFLAGLPLFDSRNFAMKKLTDYSIDQMRRTLTAFPFHPAPAGHLTSYVAQSTIYQKKCQQLLRV